ncbi:MAG: DUF2877 domain-containing protein, partial [Spirochaetaceae bacterium]|nr:DUF2877 domain-containing protein [Spirochaetaceae bacterium]
MTDPIYATLKGPFIPDDLYSLKVLSRHQGIINLLDREKELVTSLIKDKKNMTGMSLLVPDLFDMLADQNIEIKTDAQWQNSIFIDYQNTEIWPDTPAIHQMDLYPRLIELDIIKQKIKAGDSFLALLTNQYTTAFQKKGKDILENHIKRKNGKLKGLEQLVGLGQGLTPSGDDFITGALL